MKKQTKWPRPTHRVTRTTQIQGPISAFKDAAAVQRNEVAMKSLKRKPWLHNAPRHNLILALQSIARQTNLVL